MTVASGPHSGRCSWRRQQAAAAAALLAVGAAIALGCRRQAGAQSKPATYINGTAAVWDGDSLTARAPVLHAAPAVLGQAGDVSHSGKQVQGRKVRLFAIDAPELLQTCTDARGRSYDCGARPAFALGPRRSRLRKGMTPSARGGRRQGRGGRAAGAGGERIPELHSGTSRPLQEERGALHAPFNLLPARRRPRRVAAGERARARVQVRAGLLGIGVSCSGALHAPALLADTYAPGGAAPACGVPRQAVRGRAPPPLREPGGRGARCRARRLGRRLCAALGVAQGLGLAVAREQARRLGGHVDFTSAVHNKGRCAHGTHLCMTVTHVTRPTK
jgi:hypothetical protein